MKYKLKANIHNGLGDYTACFETLWQLNMRIEQIKTNENNYFRNPQHGKRPIDSGTIKINIIK